MTLSVAETFDMAVDMDSQQWRSTAPERQMIVGRFARMKNGFILKKIKLGEVAIFSEPIEHFG